MLDGAMLRETLERQMAGRSASDAWKTLIDTGACSLLVPEALGGLEQPLSAAIPVIDVLGYHGLATPFLESCVLAVRMLLIERTPVGDAVLRDIARGEIVAVAGLDPRLRPSVNATPTESGWRLDGDAMLVIDGARASHVLVAARTERYTNALLLVARDAAGVSIKAYPTIDGREAADMRFIAADAALLATDVDDALTEAGDAALACLATEAAATMRRLVADTVAYTKQREQFGQPIASFQALQHRMVDMHIQARRVQAIATRAVGALDGHWAERGRLASAAKVTAAEAGRFVGQNAVQLHGGMGMTEELPIGRLFKRLTVIEHELGNADQHRRRFASMSAQTVA